MANVPLVQPLDLSRFGHYQLPESNDRAYRSTPVQHGSPSGESECSSTPEGTPQTAHTTQGFGFSPPDSDLSPAPHSAPPTAESHQQQQQQNHQQHPQQHQQLVGGSQIMAHSHLAPGGPGPGQGGPGGPPGGGHPHQQQLVKMSPSRDQPTSYWDSSMRPPPRDLAFQPQQPYPMYREYYDSYYPQYPVAGQNDQAEERRRRELQKARRHVCPVCDKRFNRPSSLNTHMSVHTGAKPYQCQREGCGRRFSVSSNLRRHERTHDQRTRQIKPQRVVYPYYSYVPQVEYSLQPREYRPREMGLAAHIGHGHPVHPQHVAMPAPQMEEPEDQKPIIMPQPSKPNLLLHS